MKSRRRPHLEIGDVFAIPIDDTRSGLGQIVGSYLDEAYYFAIFDAVSATTGIGLVDLDEVLHERVMFLALSLDAKLFAGHWTVVGNRAVADDIPLPAYKESVGDPWTFEVVDHSGALRRPAQAAEAEVLPYRKVVAPVRLEKALRAKHGLEPWHEAYNELAPPETMTTARLFPSGAPGPRST